MAINWPDNPADKERHSEAGVIWVYRDPPGVWAVESGGDPVTIVEAETSTNTGFTIWGDTLIQWGVNTTTTAGMLAVTLPQAYDAATDYQVVAQYDRNDVPGGATWSVYAHALSGSQITLGANHSEGYSPQVAGIAWITMGAAPVALRKPKTVGVVGSTPQAAVALGEFPVGYVFISTVSTNPATTLGYGTWTAIGAGRVLVGVGDNGESVWNAGEERGSETHALTEAEMPAHAHTPVSGGVFAKPQGYSGNAAQWNLGAGSASYAPSDNITSTVGSGTPHANVQPSLGVYMFERVA